MKGVSSWMIVFSLLSTQVDFILFTVRDLIGTGSLISLQVKLTSTEILSAIRLVHLTNLHGSSAQTEEFIGVRTEHEGGSSWPRWQP